MALAANEQSMAPSRFPNVETGTGADIPLVTYHVNGNELSAPILAAAPDNLLPYQHDFERQRASWALFTALIPRQERGMLREFQIMTDGRGGVLSAVEQTGDDPRSWMLEADIADLSDTKNLAFTLLHEFGHLLTLGPTQVPPDLQVFKEPSSPRASDRAAAACDTYFPGEGCSLRTSYVNRFFDEFWQGIYKQWNAIDRVRDDEARDARLLAFYRRHEDQFVDSYAVTSPAEDIAETWAFFVLSPRPTGSTIVDRKLAFFYTYPELITLRDQILSGLCAANP